MMKDDTKSILDSLLADWHRWSKGFKVVPVCGADPMFRNAKSSKGWDSVADIVDEEISSSIMEAIDFQVSEMQEPHRSAIHETARNCATGYSVWRSPRLPEDALERGVIVLEARNQLLRRLIAAGVV